MYQTINEAVSVLGIFEKASPTQRPTGCGAGFTPKKFRWHNRTYPIEKITSIHSSRDGGVEKRRYAVISGANLYLLEYNRSKETWTLEQIWMED